MPASIIVKIENGEWTLETIERLLTQLKIQFALLVAMLRGGLDISSPQPELLLQKDTNESTNRALAVAVIAQLAVWDWDAKWSAASD